MNSIISIFLDLCKAFNTLDHQIVVKKLEYYGLNGLFIIYMNNIAQSSKLFEFIIYADDTTLSTTIEIVFRTTTYVPICDILNNELSMVNNWLKVKKVITKHKEKQIYYFSHKKEKDSKFNSRK